MKRQKSNKKNTLKSLLNNIREALVKKALSLAVIIIFLACIFLLARAYLYRSDYFLLNKVEIKETLLDQRSLVAIKSRILSAYKSKSVFTINLKAVAQSLQASYPDAKDISVSLALPDKLVVSLKLRRPVVLMRADKLYPVDEEGIILPVTDAALLKWTPVVEGAQVSAEERRAKAITSNGFKAAIGILRNIKDNRVVASYGVSTVDVRDLNNILFSLRNGVEIRIGSENFRERLAVLAKTLRDPRLMPDRIKYIDLRFGDAVIGPR